MTVGIRASSMSLLVTLSWLANALGTPRQNLRRALTAADIPAIRLYDARNAIVHYRTSDVARWAAGRGLELNIAIGIPNISTPNLDRGRAASAARPARSLKPNSKRPKKRGARRDSR